MLKQFWIIWLAMGLSLAFVYLCVCYLLRAGTFGRVLKNRFNRQTRMRVRIPITTALGLVFPPAMIAFLLYFVYRVWQERARTIQDGRV